MDVVDHAPDGGLIVRAGKIRADGRGHCRRGRCKTRQSGKARPDAGYAGFRTLVSRRGRSRGPSGRDDESAGLRHVEGEHCVVKAKRQVGEMLVIGCERLFLHRQVFQRPPKPITEEARRTAREGRQLR